jgi:hypothetical protein
MKKFDLEKFIAAVQLFTPMVLSQVPGGQKIAALVPTVTGAIVDAEAIAGATGAEKKAHALNIIAAGVVAANATGKVQLDAAAIAGIADKGIDAVVGTVKVIQAAHAVVPSHAPGPVATAAELGAPAGSTGE